MRISRAIMLLALAAVIALAGCSHQSKEEDVSTSPPEAVEESAEASPEEALPEQPPASQYSSLSALLDTVDQNHQQIQKPDIDLEAYVSGFSAEEFDYTAYSSGDVEYDEDKPLTLEEAYEDLEVMQQILRSLYTPYNYFGGDTVFNEAFDSARRMCEEAAEEGSLTAQTVWGSLYTRLTVIEDAHFSLNWYTLHSSALPYRCGEGSYLLENGIYRSLETGEAVASVDGWEDLDDLMKLSLEADGTLVYRPVIVAKEEPEPLLVQYADGSSEALTPKAIGTYGEDEWDEMVELRYNQGIPVLKVRNMGFDMAPGEAGKEFLTYLEELREEPVIIVDLRSNGGGNMMMSVKWFHQFTGQHVPLNSVGISTLSNEFMEQFDADKDNQYYVPYSEHMEYTPYVPINDKYHAANVLPDSFVPSEKTLIVLTSKNTGSAAEVFVDLAHNVENTLIVGTNTYGVILSNAFTMVWLPNSAVQVQLGSDLYLYPEGYFADYWGFMPDIWVDGDAEEAVVQMLQSLGE